MQTALDIVMFQEYNGIISGEGVGIMLYEINEIHDTVYDMTLALFRASAPGSVHGTRKLCELLVSEVSNAVGSAAWDSLVERGLAS